MIKKLRRVLICLALGLVSLLGAIACAPTELSIVLVDEFYREECIMNQEFDVTKVIENYNKNWTYKIQECGYVDNFDNLKWHEIEVVDDVKFTQTEPYDVHVVLTASSGSQKAELEFVLKLVILTDQMQATMIQSWAQAGVSKRIEGNRDYVLDGEESSVKVSYLGDEQPQVNNGVNIGAYICDTLDASLTSWDNAVMTFSVYNPQEFDIQIGWLCLKGKTNVYNGIGHMHNRTTLVAGEWTKVNWSFRAAGIDFNLTSELKINFKVRIRDASELIAPYQYSLYFCGMDIADYTPEAFPELETRTEEEIWAEANGDVADKLLCGNYTNETTKIRTAYGTELTARVKEYEAEETAPIEDSDSYIEYTMKASNVHSSSYVGNILDFTSEKPINEELYAQYQDMNWENAYITFWAYNDVEVGECNLLAMNSSGVPGAKIATLPYGEWTKVEIPLRSLYGISADPFAERPDDPEYTYNVKVFVSYSKTECHTMATYQNFASRLLIDGFAFESRYAGEYIWLTSQYTAVSSEIYKYTTATLYAEEQEFGTITAPQGTAYESFVNYQMGAGVGHSSGSYSANFLNMSAYKTNKNTMLANPMSAVAYEKYKTVDWTDAYITFWVYNASDLTASLCGTDTDFDDSKTEEIETVPTNATESAGAQITTILPKTWAKVNVSLAKECGITSDVIATGDYNIKLWWKLIDPEAVKRQDDKNTFDGTETWSFYITGFEIRNLSAAELAQQQSAWLNEQIKNNYVDESNKFNLYLAGMTLTSEVKSFDNVVSAPTSTAYSTYISYNLQATAMNVSKNVAYAGFINFSASNTGYKISTSQKKLPDAVKESYGAEFDWENASVSFWIYNNSDETAKLCGTKYYDNSTASATTKTDNVGSVIVEEIAAKTWTKITLKLSDFTSQYDVASDNYKIQLFLSYDCTEVTAENYTEWSRSFYMTGFEFVAGTASED